MRIPTFPDVLRANNTLRRYLAPTPLRSALGVFIKHENVQPTGAFKVRGGLNLLAGLKAQGIVGYSTGNHAQSLAYAAAIFDVPCVIVMPVNPNPTKANAVRSLGAELVEAGANFDEARQHAVDLAKERGLRLVSAADEPDIIAGVATAYLELFQQQPDIDTVIVPAGSGSGAAAACLVAAAVAPTCEIIAVQSAQSPAAHDSWRAEEIVDRPNKTVAEGLATGSGFELPQHILRRHLTDFVLVDDAAIRHAQWVMLRDAQTLAESAGAAPLAAYLAEPDRFRDKKVALVCTGANASEAEIRDTVYRG
ncbi:threonine/serine dehydratase [Kutzneria buriramensis]|uniref:threonine ammonia-lyase n=1 Tax=Kutzneria buriramensis TaxID=1045776 RepID=A0A3E0I5M5_9PSEU|nr:pyridoxal-phosphate dependent enzyme [Kutzneria buriramensis]REH54042.1 threonine dehydratase [Kutzneria buriramensis]